MIQAVFSLKKPVQQTVKLLDTVEMQISLDPHKFYKFMNELEKDSADPMQNLCHKLRSTCGEYVHDVRLSTTTDQWCSGVAQLKSSYMPFDEVLSLPTNTSGEQRMCTCGIMHVTICLY